MNEFNDTVSAAEPSAQSALPVPPAPQKKRGKFLFIFQIVICCIGIALGIIFVISGLGIYGSGDYEWGTVTFGADFYTEIYAVTQDASFNTYVIVRLIKEGIHLISVFLGACMSLCFLLKLCSVIEKRKNQTN